MTWSPASRLREYSRSSRSVWAVLAVLVLFLAAFGAGVSLVTLRVSSRAQRAAELGIAYQKARAALASEYSLAEDYVNHPNQQELDGHRASALDVEAALVQIQELGGPGDGQIAAEALSTQQGYKQAAAQVFSAVDAGDTVGVEEFDRTVDPFVTSLQDIVGGAAQRRAVEAAAELESIQHTQTGVLIATSLAFVIGSLLLGVVWLVFTDYQRRLVEGARRELEQARRSEERFRSLVQNTYDTILILDSEGIIRYASPAAEHTWGYADDTLVGTPALSLVTPEDQARIRAEFSSNAHESGVTWTTELGLRRADGTVRDVEAIATNLLDRPSVGGVVVTYRDMTERTAHERQLKQLAFVDSLTGLANWQRLRGNLDRMLVDSPESEFALLLLDLDDFADVNNTLGHESGDQLLRGVGERLAAEVGEGDLLARLDGDEFVVVLRGAETDQARAAADRLLAAVDMPLQINGVPLQLSGSVGIALHPEHGQDTDSLVRRAEVAMHTARDTRRGFVVYAPDQDRHSPERLALVHDLRGAIDRGEFVLHFQPQIDVRSGAVSGCEALLRWLHPRRGLVSPDEFIPLALESRLIQPLSRWVLRAALEQCAAWRLAGLSLPVSVNLSTYDLQDASLPEYIAQLIARDPGLSQALRIEITESSLMVDPPRSREVLARLRALGIQVAIDDFGTGYSSLAYLKDLPVDELKIDKSFVRDMARDDGARAIVRAVIDLADDLGLRVVAEGVEDRATWEALGALGCDLAQGYYFSRPLVAHEFATWAHSAQNQLELDEAFRVDAALAERVRERGARLTAEEEFIARKRAEAALRESEERLRLAVQAADLATRASISTARA